jgi:hypothetical protein
MDALLPFIILMVINLILLISWTVVAPLKWTRSEKSSNHDEFGRAEESYGYCEGDGSVGAKVIWILLIVVNAFVLVFTNYQCYKTRSLPTEFNESFYMAVTNASLLETLVLAFPILLVVSVNDSPSASFILRAIFVTTVCLCILLPYFVPKHMQRNIQELREQQGRDSAVLSVEMSRQPRRISGLNPNYSSELSNDQRHHRGLRVTRHADYFVQIESECQPVPAT